MIYLASQSPRRRELLAQIGITHQVISATIDETPLADESAEDYVQRMALEKARAGHRLHNDQPVLGADTAVVLDGHILGKPDDQQHAQRMLLRLSGREHRVLTGAALVAGNREHYRMSDSRVTFRDITRVEAANYWQSGEPADKAGAYAIQGLGALFVCHLSGSYSGVMGLPLFETAELLRAAGITLLGQE